MGIFIAFALGIITAVMAPKLVKQGQDKVVATLGPGYVKIADVRCPSCLAVGLKSHAMVIDIKDDLQRCETSYRCTRGHEWTVIVTKENESSK